MIEVDNRTFFYHAFHSLGLLFEIIPFVDVLNDLLVLVLHVFDLLLEVLKFKMEGLYLLNSFGVATLPHRLSH